MTKLLLLCALGLLASVLGQPPPEQKDPKISYDLNDVNFFMWTTEFGLDNPLPFYASTAAIDLLKHGFKPDRQTKVLSHGWNSAGKEFADDFVKAYFTHKDQGYNVIAINWAPLATWDNYFGAASNALKVGKHSAQVLGHLLIEQMGQDPSMIHAIGHSLGGHLVGHFGRNIESIFGKGKIARVTALDPAGPWFDVTAVSNRVAKTDADFVDVIHTNSGSLLNLCLSLKEPLGHIDFYPNGGSHQAGCNDICLADLCTESNLIDLFRGACSHGRVVDLYVESILHAPHVDVFLSKSCEDWNQYEVGNCQDEFGEIEMGEGLTRNEQVLNQRNLSILENITSN